MHTPTSQAGGPLGYGPPQFPGSSGAPGPRERLNTAIGCDLVGLTYQVRTVGGSELMAQQTNFPPSKPTKFSCDSVLDTAAVHAVPAANYDNVTSFLLAQYPWW